MKKPKKTYNYPPPDGVTPVVHPWKVQRAEVVIICPYCDQKHRYNLVALGRMRFCSGMERCDDHGFLIAKPEYIE